MLNTLSNIFRALYRKRDSILLQVIVIAVVVLILVLLGIIYPSTRLGFYLVIILAVINPRLRGFGIDFLPFMILLIVYNDLRKLADDVGSTTINITNLIDWEKALFGGALPGHWLQSHLWGHFYTPAVDLLANGFYLSHFITPVILAGMLWYFRRNEYWAFMIGLVTLSFAAFATYLLFPAAPPWWATAHGYLDGTPITLSKFIVDEASMASGPNPVAAMPSLHIGYPTYLALVSVTVWGKRGLPVFLLPLALLFSAVYLGHHYVIDGLAGAAYALIVYSTVYWWLRRKQVDLNPFRMWQNTRARREKSAPQAPRHDPKHSTQH